MKLYLGLILGLMLTISCNVKEDDSRIIVDYSDDSILNPGSGDATPNGGDASPLEAVERAIDSYAPVTYQDHVSVLLNARCIKCHSGPQAAGNLDLEDFEAVKSNVNKLIGAIENRRMPPTAGTLPPEGLKRLDFLKETLRSWTRSPSNFADSFDDILDIDFSRVVRPLTDGTCGGCHDIAAPKGNVRLSSQEDWEEKIDTAADAVKLGRMPPKLDPERRKRILDVFEIWQNRNTP